MPSLNPKATLKSVPRGNGGPGIPSISNTKSSPTIANSTPEGSFIERDLAYIRSLGPGCLPWECPTNAENSSLR